MIKNIFLALTSILLILCVVLLGSSYKVYLYNDISVEPISKQDNVDFQTKEFKNRHPVYLVSYADGHEVFYQNQNTLVLSALNKGFDFFLNYRRSHIDPDFYEKHKHILDERTGAGYWLWKPYFILKTLEQAPEGAIVMYVDSGLSLKKSPKELLNLTQKHDIVLIEYDPEIYGRVINIAQHETLQKMGCTDFKCIQGNLTWAAFSLFKNTEKSRRFLREWLKFCTDKNNVTCALGKGPKNEHLRNCVHDQGVLSVLRAKQPEEIHTISRDQALQYLSWHHRHPRDLYKSILPNLFKGIRGWERGIINSDLFKFVRRKLFTQEA